MAETQNNIKKYLSLEGLTTYNDIINVKFDDLQKMIAAIQGVGICECTTGANVANKQINVTGNSSQVILVYFTQTNAANNPKLRVNNKNYDIVYNGETITDKNLHFGGYAGCFIAYALYDGKYYVFGYSNQDSNNALIGCGYAVCRTSEYDPRKSASLPGYVLTNGGIVTVKFNNNVGQQSTLNIEDSGWINIYHNDALINDNVINAGDTATFIYNSNNTDGYEGYHLICIDKDWQGKIDEVTNNFYWELDGHTTNSDIHFTAAERTKLSGIAAGAQVNTITGVKGNSESSYRTGNVNITKANIGLGNVDNTSDANKPISTAQQLAFDKVNNAIDTHTENDDIHVTTTNKTNWNAAKTHADSAHAPSDAQKNQNAFSNVKVGSTTIAADTTTDTLELVGSNVTITPDATNDKVTIAVADATTSAKGVVQLSDSVTSDSSTTAATSYSVRAAHKLAGQAYDLANSKADHTHNHTVSQIGDLTVSASELNYMDGVTSNVQAQLDSKASSSHNHSGSDITSGTVSASRLPVASNSASGIINTSAQTIAGQKTFANQIIAKDGILTNKNIVPDTASTRDIGTSMLPFKGVYAKDLYVKPQVIGGSISYCGRFIAEQAGTTTTRGVTTLEVGNFIEEGRDGNAQGYIEIFNNNTGSVTLSTSHDDNRDLHVYLPESGGTLVTNKNVYTKDEVYSKADQKWNLLYDSGEISAIANSISNIDVSGYTNIQVLVRIYNDGDSVGSRAGSAIFKCANGKNYQFPVWANMFSKSINTVYVMATFNLVDGWLICPCASRLIGDATTFEDTEGGTAGSLAPTGSGMMKCTSPLSTLTISSLDQNSNYYFGMGSRVIVWGWNG